MLLSGRYFEPAGWVARSMPRVEGLLPGRGCGVTLVRRETAGCEAVEAGGLIEPDTTL